MKNSKFWSRKYQVEVWTFAIPFGVVITSLDFTSNWKFWIAITAIAILDPLSKAVSEVVCS